MKKTKQKTPPSWANVVIHRGNTDYQQECEDIYNRNMAKMGKMETILVDRLGLGRREADSANPKDALGNKKPAMWLNPRAGLIWTAKAFEFGAYGTDAEGTQVRPKGYGPYNWREKPVKASVYIAAMERHLAEYLDGDDKAWDSKVYHLAHIAACAFILIDAKEHGNLIDDRPIKGPAAKIIAALTLKDKPTNELKTYTSADDLARDFGDCYRGLFPGPSGSGQDGSQERPRVTRRGKAHQQKRRAARVKNRVS